ncbi:MAG: beta-lactamase family protein, partial [Bacteroidales bacterium]|nr:beta-lactamase family protein [Bacteroidales bacterium]
MRMSKRARILAATFLALAALAIVAITSFGKKEKEIHRIPVNLNETLTNEMSDTSVLEGFDKKVKDYMTYWGLHGASLSVMRNDSLLFSKGYGWADEKEPMTPGHILRMASVSKLITTVGIMVLEEKGLLRLDDQVFGPGGILDDSLYNAAIADSLYMKITVEDLLRHKGGFSKKGGDPMFSTRWIMSQNAWKEVPTKEQLTVLQL